MQDANKNRLYVHEVFLAENIKKGDTLQTAASQPHGGISLHRDILANVLSESKDTTSEPENQIAEQEVVEEKLSTYAQIEQAEQNIESPLLVREDSLYDKSNPLMNDESGQSAWPYPSAEENDEMKPFFDTLFGTIQEREENGKAVLYQIEDSDLNTAEAKMSTEEVLDLVKAAGIEVEIATPESISTEEQEIIAKAKANGTYLKAPNGKPTNLTPRQWVQVRTKAFKRWFGSWDIGAMVTPIHRSKGGFKNLTEAEKWAKENLRGKSVRNLFTNEEISIGSKSIKEMLDPKFAKNVNEQVHMSALQSVLDFIKTGIPAEIHKDTKERGFDVMRLYNAIEIDGVVYRVKSTVRKVKQGDRYYTYEVQEMELLEDTQEALGLLNTDNGRQLNSNNSITGAKLLKGVKKTNSNEEILSYSKVVDANGEPKVVYHQTNATIYISRETGQNWDELYCSERGVSANVNYSAML